MRYFFILIIIISISAISLAQERYDYHWKFGYRAKVGEDTVGQGGGNTISFLENQVKLYGDDKQYSDISRTSATISNRQGELQFFSNGCWIENTAGEIMENGDSITTGFLALVNDCDDEKGNLRINQGAVILPSSLDSNRYFFISQVSEVFDPPGPDPLDFTVIRLQYALVDMNYNQGLGKVLVKEQVIVDDSLQYNGVIATRHGNGQDWWILQVIDSTNQYYRIQFQNDSFKMLGVQQIGLIEGEQGQGSGNSVFSADGSHYARYDLDKQIQLFRFDNQTGLLSEMHQLFIRDTLANPGSIAFSPSGRFMYATNYDTLWQFDLDASNIQMSRTVVGIWDGYYQGSLPTVFNQMQPGPDCRLYMSLCNYGRPSCMSFTIRIERDWPVALSSGPSACPTIMGIHCLIPPTTGQVRRMPFATAPSSSSPLLRRSQRHLSCN